MQVVLDERNYFSSVNRLNSFILFIDVDSLSIFNESPHKMRRRLLRQFPFDTVNNNFNLSFPFFAQALSQFSSRKNLFGNRHEVFFLNLEDGYFGCQVNESVEFLQIYELSRLCDGLQDCYMGSDELRKELKCTSKLIKQTSCNSFRQSSTSSSFR